MNSEYLRGIAVGMMFLGVLMLSVSSTAFTTTGTDRTAQVQVPDSPDAYIGLENLNNGVTKTGSTGVIRIYNNINETVELQTNLQTGQRLQAVDEADGASISSGDVADVTVECNKGGTGQEQVTLTLLDATTTDGSVSVSDASITNTVVYDCTGGGTGNVDFQASNVDASESVQTFSISPDGGLGNGQTATIDLTDPQQNGGVDYTGLTADVISGKGGITYDSTTNYLNYTAQGNENNIEIEISNFGVPGSNGGTVEYEDQDGRLANDDFQVFDAIVDAGESTGDIQVEGDISVDDGATTDGEVDAGGDAIYGNDTTAAGEVGVEGDLTAGDEFTSQDEVDVGGELNVGDNSTTQGGVGVEDDLTTGDGFTAQGEIDVGGKLSVGNGTSLQGEVGVEGSLTGGDGFVSEDDLDVEGELVVGDDSSLQGDVTVGDDFTMGDNSNIQGEVDIGGTATFGSGVTVTSEVSIGQDMYIGDGAVFEDDVAVSGTAYVGCNVEFQGEAPSNIEDNC